MKNIFLTLSAAAVLAASVAPAAMAQPYRGGEYRQDYRGPGFNGGRVDNLDRLGWRIDNAVRDGRISRGEARRLHGELREAQNIAWRIQTGRAGRFERDRLDRLVGHIQVATSGDYRYGRNDQRRFGY